MRLIDADAACEATYREIYLTESEQAAYRAFIRSQPTADAVFVVRCKGCKSWRRNVGIVDSPNGHCFMHDDETNGQDYCSDGEVV